MLIGNVFLYKEIDIWGLEVMIYEYYRSGLVFFFDFLIVVLIRDYYGY